MAQTASTAGNIPAVRACNALEELLAMSHKATNWAVQQRGIKPAAKVVLWHLADRHNPDNGCFPSQELLARDCEMSRSSLNDQLNVLEAAGLIRRVQRYNSDTKRAESTRYILAFEDGMKPHETKPCPKSGHGAVSENESEPCPKNAESRVRNSDSNPVREPVSEPARERASGSLPTDEQLQAFLSAYPEKGLANMARETVRLQIGQAAVRHDTNLEAILMAAARYGARVKKLDTFPIAVSRWFADRALVAELLEGQRPTDPATTSLEQWRGYVGYFYRHSSWHGPGPDPKKPGCLAPAEALAEYGYDLLTDNGE